MSPRSKLVAIDLFCGAGGLSIGFEQAGFRVVLAVEQDAHAAKTYMLNHPRTDVVTADIRGLDPAECLERAGVSAGELTALIGGPPCQGFSESNRRTRTLENPKNYLYRDFLRFVRVMYPEWVIIENVAGLRTLNKRERSKKNTPAQQGYILRNILRGLRRLGYVADAIELNAAEHGVPQVRRRLFIIGNRLGASVPKIEASHGTDRTPFVTVIEAIGDLPRLKVGAVKDVIGYRAAPSTDYQRRMRAPGAAGLILPLVSDDAIGSGAGRRTASSCVLHRVAPRIGQVPDGCVTGNLVSYNAPHVTERYPFIPQGGNWESIPSALMRNYEDATRCHTGIYHRLSANAPAKVIGNFRKNMLIHPRQHRGLSVREAARLQSFPDWYRFSGSLGYQQQQVADGVPPLLAEVVARAVLKSRQSAQRKSCRDRQAGAR